MPTQPCVETEAAPSRMEREEEHHHGKEDVGPRPLRRAARSIDPEPEVQHEYDRQGADQTYAEPENERNGEGELGKKNDRIEDVEIGKIELGNEIAIELGQGAMA